MNGFSSHTSVRVTAGGERIWVKYQSRTVGPPPFSYPDTHRG
ncbi:hypothetical protein [Streptomyces sp. NBC_00385]|nr:hypothetical protein [Streptomyces sp. NBC_00385]WRZ04137.1 hypothetical protein OG959_12625 [Streptomyces sp. NBC_00385]